MGNANKTPSGLPRPLHNQITFLFQDKDFLKLVDNLRKTHYGRLNKFNSYSEADVSCHREIHSYLRRKDLPENWVEPIFSYITHNEMNVPLDGGIALRVGRQEVSGKGEQVVILDKNGRLANQKNSVSIVLTAKVSTDRIIKFVKKNKKLIEDFQKTINLPEYKPLNWKELDLGLKIIRLKDEKKLTFSAIADELEKQENVSSEDLKEMPDEAGVKTLYHRYKKRLSKR